MEYITTTSFTIAINGSFEGFFKGGSGIRQGDPLSPYIFVICMEVLSCMLNRLNPGHGFNFHPHCEKLSLNHLCFANDLFLFCKGDLGSVQAIYNTLCSFHLISGMRINLAKSEIYCAGISPSVTADILNGLGFRMGQLPIRYLGIPLISRKIRNADCKLLIEKITARINHWSSKWLTYAGRVSLIKSVLQSICTFWASVIEIPKGTIQDIERKFRAFLWRSTGARIAWNTVCLPYKEGGLGVRHIEDINRAFISNISGDSMVVVTPFGVGGFL